RGFGVLELVALVGEDERVDLATQCVVEDSERRNRRGIDLDEALVDLGKPALVGELDDVRLGPPTDDVEGDVSRCELSGELRPDVRDGVYRLNLDVALSAEGVLVRHLLCLPNKAAGALHDKGPRAEVLARLRYGRSSDRRRSGRSGDRRRSGRCGCRGWRSRYGGRRRARTHDESRDRK